MTLTIDLGPELQQQLQEEAVRRGVPTSSIPAFVRTWAADVLRASLQTADIVSSEVLQREQARMNRIAAEVKTQADAAERMRIELIDSIAGKYADASFSSDELMQERHEDNERDEALYAQRFDIKPQES